MRVKWMDKQCPSRFSLSWFLKYVEYVSQFKKNSSTNHSKLSSHVIAALIVTLIVSPANNVRMPRVYSRLAPLALPYPRRKHVFLAAQEGNSQSLLSIMTPEILGETIRPKSRRELIKLPHILVPCTVFVSNKAHLRCASEDATRISCHSCFSVLGIAG